MPAALTHPDGVVRPIQAYQDLPDLLFRFSPWKARVSEESRYLCCAALHWGSMSDGYLRATEALVAAGAPLDPTGATCRQQRCNIQRTARTRPPRGSMRVTHAACNPARARSTASAYGQRALVAQDRAPAHRTQRRGHGKAGLRANRVKPASPSSHACAQGTAVYPG